MNAIEQAKSALEAADEFIRNGVEFGYIRMPDMDTPDSAKDTPAKIRAALAALSAPAQMTDDEILEEAHLWFNAAYAGWDNVISFVRALESRLLSSAAAPQQEPTLRASFQVNRGQFHDKVWAIFHQKAQADATLQKLSIHTVRTFANAMYEAGCLPFAAPVAAQQQDELLERIAASFVHSFGSDDRLDPAYIAQCIRSHKSAQAKPPEASAPAQAAEGLPKNAATNLLNDLVAALDATNWSSWQTTARFNDELEAARDFLAASHPQAAQQKGATE